MKKTISVIHGPNLNRLGTRQPAIYGMETLNTLNASLKKHAQAANIKLQCFQSNHEGELVDIIQQISDESCDGIILNPAAFTHSSIAMRDALLGSDIPFIEVHISNIFARETFRQHSYFSDIALGIISGLGTQAYHLALDAFIHQFNQ